MIEITDHIDQTVSLSEIPRRIVSIVPSQTELLHWYGLEEEVVGITKFCIHPPHWYRDKIRVGGTKKIDIQKVAALNPDLIIANKEENTKEDVAALQAVAPTYVSDIKGLDDALSMINDLGKLCGRQHESDDLKKKILAKFESLSTGIEPNHKPKVLYLIWKDPIMAAGKETFIEDMLKRSGFINVLSTKDQRYPRISEEHIRQMAPDVLLLSSEPFPFKGKHSKEMRQRFPNILIKEVDGEVFSWYGSRLLKTADYLLALNKELRYNT